MFIKKITTLILLSSQLLALIGAFVLLHPINATIAVSQGQENIQSEDLSEQEQQEVIITGNASYGTNPVTGRVRIITNRKQLSTLVGGDIVVAPAINSFWYSGLSMASAIITEKNDNNALALGKKLNIPVITGASGATKKMVDNEIVICDPLTRNVYHVSYPTPQDVHFDVLTIPNNDRNNYFNKSEKTSKLELPHVSAQQAMTNMECSLQPIISKKLSVPSNEKRKKRVTASVYRSHFDQFKKFVLGEKSQFKWTKEWFGMGAVEAGARSIGRCNDFAVECICVGEEFFSSDDAHVVQVLQNIGRSDHYIQYMDELIDECSPGDLNKVALVSHRKHIEVIDVPSDVKKEDLINHPRKYKAIEHRIDKEKREALIAAGLFARYWIKKKLPL